MKKIININFHSRVIPIEETAYEILKQYVEDLRKYFANEEGRDEIVSDIENRFAELFSDRLKKGSTCITDEDVNAIIASMGRPEDFEQDELGKVSSGSQAASQQAGPQQSQQQYAFEPHRRLYRSENDRILGGVCGGLANYLRLDPAIVRILFALITFGGFGLGVLVYIVLWIAVPSRSLATNIRKRLYRNPDDKVIAGVAGGLSAYFHIDVWIFRVIFALPLIAGIIGGIFHNAWFDFDPFPVFAGGFGGTFVITYIILWVALPEAVTASEKLEMRGEKVDIESIKNTIKSDIEGFNKRTKDMGEDIKQRAEQFASEFKQTAKNFGSEVGPAARRTSSGIGHAIGVLFKAFFLFIAGCIAFALIMVLVALLFSGVGVFPFKNYLLTGFWQNFFAWSTLCLFLGVPVLALLIWLIRRIAGVRSRNHFLGFVFGGLWTIGLISLIVLVASIGHDFRSRATVQEEIPIAQPAGGKVLVKVEPGKVKYYGSDWFGFNDDMDWPFFSLNEDSLMLRSIRVELVKSQDSAYHTYAVKMGRGDNPHAAQDVASKINFPTIQHDSVLLLPKGFAIAQHEKFRNQQVLVIVEVPVGKKIEVDRSVNFYHWFDINFNRYNSWNFNWNDDWDNSYNWNDNTEYIMTNEGLAETHPVKNRVGDDNEDEDKPRETHKEGYRYKKNHDSTTAKKGKDSIKTKAPKTRAGATDEKTPAKEAGTVRDINEPEDAFSPTYNLANLI